MSKKLLMFVVTGGENSTSSSQPPAKAGQLSAVTYKPESYPGG